MSEPIDTDTDAEDAQVDDEYFDRFLVCSVFGPPPEEIKRAQAYIAALRARVADLEAFVREPVPFGAYVRWCQDGNTPDADAMQAWSDARAAALGAPGGES